MKYVICVNASGMRYLTKGKVYKCLGKGLSGRFCRVIDNFGRADEYLGFRFRPVILNKINRLLYKGF